MARIKPEIERKDATVAVPMKRATRRELEEIAERDGVPLSELGRVAFEAFLRSIERRAAR